MGSKLMIIVVIIGIFVVMGIVRDGTEGLKESPLQSIWDSGKTVVSTGANIVNKFGDNETITDSGLIEVGQIPCVTDADCNLLEECKQYKCLCLEESCFLKE